MSTPNNQVEPMEASTILVSVRRASEILGISPDAIKRRLKRGDLDGYQERKRDGSAWVVSLSTDTIQKNDPELPGYRPPLEEHLEVPVITPEAVDDTGARVVWTSLDYWVSLRGVGLEREVGKLFEQLRYEVQFTPASGDQGIDLILKRAGQTTLVQCKGYAGPAGSPVVRDLNGTLHHFRGASDAILVCPSGFTREARAFVRDEPIILIDGDGLINLAKRSQEGSCPTPGCQGGLAGKTFHFASTIEGYVRKCDLCRKEI